MHARAGGRSRFELDIMNEQDQLAILPRWERLARQFARVLGMLKIGYLPEACRKALELLAVLIYMDTAVSAFENTRRGHLGPTVEEKGITEPVPSTYL